MIGWRLSLSLFFLGLMSIVLAFSERRLDDVLLTAFLSICCITPLIIPKRRRMYGRRNSTMSVRVLRFSTISQMFVILEAWIPIIRMARLWNEDKLAKNVRPSGQPHDPEKMATFSTRVSAALLPLCAIVGIVGFIYVDIYFLAAMAAPVIMFFLPMVQLKMETMERRSRIEEETAYFLSYVNIMQSINTGLYKSFDAIRGSKVFPAMEKDASEIVKRVVVLGMSQNDSLDIYAKSHPSQKFSEFVSGYLAKITSVGNVPGYTEAKAKYFFTEYIGVWDKYAKSATEIFGAILMIALILPMMISFIAVMGSPESAGIMFLMGMALPPMVAIMMIVMLNSSQPSTGNSYAISYMAFVPGVIIGFSALLAGVDVPTVIALSAFTVGILNYSFTKKASREVDIVDRMMPEFMRDITEMSKTGMNVGQIIQMQASKNSYKGHFNKILHGMNVNIRRGMSFDKAAMKIKTKSKQVKFIMFLLARTYITGGGTTEIFYNITNFITDIEQKKRQITSSLTSLTMIVYFAPFLMLGVSNIMVGMFSGFESDQLTDASAIGLKQIDDSMIGNISFMAVVTSLSMGMVAAKISSYTVKNTLPLAISSLTTVLAIHLVPILIDELNLF